MGGQNLGQVWDYGGGKVLKVHFFGENAVKYAQLAPIWKKKERKKMLSALFNLVEETNPE